MESSVFWVELFSIELCYNYKIFMHVMQPRSTKSPAQHVVLAICTFWKCGYGEQKLEITFHYELVKLSSLKSIRQTNKKEITNLE